MELQRNCLRRCRHQEVHRGSLLRREGQQPGKDKDKNQREKKIKLKSDKIMIETKIKERRKTAWKR